jgi:MFS family permease
MSENKTLTAQPPEFTSSYRYVMATNALISQIALAMCLGILSPLGPYIREALGMNFTQFGLLFTLSNAGTMIFLWLTGPLVDRFGIRRIMVGGTVIMAIGMYAASRSTTAMQLIILQLCLGICNSVAGPTGSKIISTWIGTKDRNFHMGLRQAGIPLNSIITGFAIPVIATHMDWRTAYVVVATFVLAVGILSGLLYRESSVLSEISNTRTVASGFKENMADFFKRDFIFLSVGCLLLMGTQFALSTNMSNYCAGILKAHEMGDTAGIAAGRIYSYACIGGIIGRLVWGHAADKVGSKKTLITINILAAILLVILGISGEGIGLTAITIVMILYGFTGFAWTGVQLGMASHMASVKATATAIGVTLSFSFFGMMLFPPLFGKVVDVAGFAAAWYFIAVFTLLGVLLLAPIKEKI